MDKRNREFLMACGYKEASDIAGVICRGKVNNLSIEIYNNSRSVLLARVKEKKAVIAVEGHGSDARIIIMQPDRLKTHLFNVPLLLIADAVMEKGKRMTDVLFHVGGDGYTYRVCYEN